MPVVAAGVAGVVAVGVAVRASVVDAPGEAGVAVGLVTGVMMTPVTFPLRSAVFFLLSVPRARRVAAALALAAVRAAPVRGLDFLLGAMANAFKVVGEL